MSVFVPLSPSIAYRPTAHARSVPKASTAYRLLYQGRSGAGTSLRDVPSQWNSHASPEASPTTQAKSLATAETA